MSIYNVNLLIGEKTVTIVPDLKNNNDHLNFYAILKYFFNLEGKIESVFGVFLDKILCVIKKKTRKEFYNNFSHETMLSILEGENIEAYYTEKNNLEKLIGIEIRFNDETST